MNAWHALKAVGYAYFEVYTTADDLPVAWISRVSKTEPYTYDCFYEDGNNRVEGTRGSMANARAFMHAAIAKYSPS